MFRTVLSIIVAVAAVACCNALAVADESTPSDSGFKPIFNGQDLTGWEGDPQFWRVEGGAIVGHSTRENPVRQNTFLIWRDGTVDDFVLRMKYRLRGGNSGIQYRSTDRGNFSVGGYQADFDAGHRYSGANYDERGRGMLAERGQRTTIAPDGTKASVSIGDAGELRGAIHNDDWNQYEIVAQGSKLTHKINGKLMSEVIDNQEDQREFSGILALQLHTGPPMTVEFKDIELKRTRLNDGRKKLVMVAGRPSHAPGEHEFNAGVWLLKKCLDENVPQLLTVQYRSGWPSDPTAFDNADGVFLFMDGGARHPVIQQNRLAEMANLMRQGVGIACAHYAVEVTKEKGGAEFLDWMGGYFEPYWSVNPHWRMENPTLANDHAVTRGVEPFPMQDEWYYHMRFRDGMEGVTPILSAVPPEETRQKPDGPHSGNPHVRARSGQAEVLAWAVQRPDGGRGYGFTGGHFHKNWGDENFRKLMLNALVWTAGLEVPEGGVPSRVSEEDLQQNLDPKRPRR